MVRPDSFCSSSLISVPVRSALPALLSYFWSGRGAIYKSLLLRLVESQDKFLQFSSRKIVVSMQVYLPHSHSRIWQKGIKAKLGKKVLKIDKRGMVWTLHSALGTSVPYNVIWTEGQGSKKHQLAAFHLEKDLFHLLCHGYCHCPVGKTWTTA